jgi:hypothetical protein
LPQTVSHCLVTAGDLSVQADGGQQLANGSEQAHRKKRKTPTSLAIPALLVKNEIIYLF